MPNHDDTWVALLRGSGSTFEAEPAPPYGFVTSTIARLNAEKGQQEAVERVGWRALLASFAALAIAAMVTLAVSHPDRSNDFEPGVRSIVAVDNVPVS